MVTGLEVFLNKEVKIYLRTNYKYQGVVQSVSSSFILVQEIKEGLIAVNYKDIKEIKFVEGQK